MQKYCSRLSRIKQGIVAVSYTHLDVYKRQVFQDYLAMINSGAFMELDDLIQSHGQDMLAKDKEKNLSLIHI